MSLNNFNLYQSGFLTGLATLSQKFPPASYPEAWLSLLNKNVSSQKQRFLSSNLLLLLLEISNSSCSSVSELISLVKIISAIFAGFYF